MLALYSVAELLRETGNTFGTLNAERGQFIFCLYRDHRSSRELYRFKVACVYALGSSCCCTGVVTGEFEVF